MKKKLAKQGKDVNLLRILHKLGYLDDRKVIFLKTGDGVGLNLEKSKHRLIIEGFDIDRRIGRGGTATVYLARRLSDGLPCAIKILFPHHRGHKKMVERFLNEGKLLQRLQHPNIVAGYDTGKSNGLYYVALEYVPGHPVKQIIDTKGSLSEELSLHVILQTAKAIHYLATKGVTHRDIKPGNILITRDGSTKLCDLGFAKLADEGVEQGYTWGTAMYISPEQVSGTQDLDVRSDIYSLGATLYHMVIGEVPFKAATHAEIMSKQVQEALSSEKVKSRNISRQMHYFLEKMMAKEREIRYEHADELIEDVGATVEGSRQLLYDPSGQRANDPLREVHEYFAEHGDPDDETAVKPRDSRRLPRGETRMIRKEAGKDAAPKDPRDRPPRDSSRRSIESRRERRRDRPSR